MAIKNSKNVTELDEHTFQAEILGAPTLALVDFGATWCGPCKALAPTVEALANDYLGQLKVGTVDIENHPEIAARYQVRSVPTLLFFKGGQVVSQLVGAMPRAKIEAELRKALGT